jgi:hypothetical protein
MRRTFFHAAAVVAALIAGTALVFASSIDTYIQDLKSDKPEVRAKAAYELGCG